MNPHCHRSNAQSVGLFEFLTIGRIRAFAVAALGYDPGEPDNTAHVRCKIFAGRQDAIVSYRNRFQEVCVPDIAGLPVWNTTKTWQPTQQGVTPC